MSHLLDDLDPIYTDDIADLIWMYTLDADGDDLTPENYIELKMKLLAYFKELEDDSNCRRGLGFDFIEFLDKTFGSLVKLHNAYNNNPLIVVP